MEHLVVPTFVLDHTGKVIIWNKACERLTGVPADTVIGTSLHWMGFYKEERVCLADLVLHSDLSSIDEFYAVNLSTAANNGIVSAENWCRFPKTDAERYLAIDAGPIFDDNGQLIAVVETLRDITEQKEAQEKLEILARQDSLTGLANRRLFDEHLVAEWQLAAGTEQALSLLMIDIDHFKPYNDTLGHLAGDVCLKRIAGIISAEIRREGDLCARYGGEEFAVILPRTNREGAVKVSERIIAAIRAARIPNPGIGKAGRITLSVGVASWQEDQESCADLLADADTALYAAKQAGRSCVRAAAPQIAA
ncbi:sensor domain-containing diguanylate cyclase [Jiella marina]|uniref:sensor domain-containing diguanylate cyclase n=1 Tax=Jiella sp. LLJ827 TaxID=2917712 RepID=UPI0021012A85|nr:diguanylate cyclase [Jiella sp. LLJ827]MCQ0987323.1 diguanylate cyclase [Jiella sp. LLJ827]